MGNTKTVFTIVSVTDQKAMESYFEEMAAQGWMLESIKNNWFCFRKTEPQKRKFCVDIFPSGVLESPENCRTDEYIVLCEDSGWEYVTGTKIWKVFSADAGQKTIPLQTDPAVEAEALKKTFRKEFGWLAVSILSFLFLCGANLRAANFQFLFSNSGVMSILFFPAYVLWLLLWCGEICIRYRKAQKILRIGQPLPASSMRAVRRRNRAFFVPMAVLLLLMILAAVSDALVTGFTGLFIFLLPSVLVLAVIPARKILLAGRRSPLGTALRLIGLGAGSAVLLTTLFAVGFVILKNSRPGTEHPKPAGVVAVTIRDFAPAVTPTNEYRNFNYYVQSSVLVPVNYTYYEDQAGFGVSTQVIRAVSRGLAGYLFGTMIGNQKSFFRQTVENAPAAEWGADKAFYINNHTELWLLKGRVIYELECFNGFDDPLVKQVFKNRLKL